MRVAVVGATGALGTELLAVLDETRLAIDALVPIATDRSLGTDVEFQSAAMAVETSLAALRGADLAFLCTPPAAALEATRLCLHGKVAVIDCSGALAAAPEVPLVAELQGPGVAALDAPALAIPPGLSLAAARVLGPLHRSLGGVAGVGATLLESASGAGRAGVSALSEETIALLSQHDAPDPPALGHPIAFDVLPWVGTIEDDGTTQGERTFEAVIGRLLGGAPVSATALRVPVFCGDGAILRVEATAPVTVAAAIEALAKTDGIVLGAPAPTTRAAAGSDAVHVGRIRRDPARESGLLLWLAADGLRLTAAHAVRVAEARFGRV
jgi:aspartate-semialdehyde dehydrogenase